MVGGNTSTPTAHAGIRSRAWCFTAQVPDYWERNDDVFEHGIQEAEYMVWQIERVGHTHIQGYVYFEHARTMASTKAAIFAWCGIQAHLSKARGTPAQNKAYCTKTESRVEGPWEMGSMLLLQLRCYEMLEEILKTLTNAGHIV